MNSFLRAFLICLALTSTAFAQNANSSGVFPNAQGQLPSMANGIAPSTIFAATASSTINSSSDTSCFGTGVGSGATIPANGPYAGNTYRLLCRGVYTAPAANLATSTVKIKWGATTVASVTTAALTSSATDLPFSIDVICTIRTAGASGSMICGGSFQYAGALTGLATVFNSLSIASVATINTTVSSKIDATMAINGSLTTQSASGIAGVVEILY